MTDFLLFHCSNRYKIERKFLIINVTLVWTVPKIYWINKILVLADSGYTGINKIRKNVKIPLKKSKKKSLTREDKKNNRKISSQRVVNENVIGYLKRFKIISDRYRNRRKRFGLRFNLIAGICNRDLAKWDGYARSLL